MSNRDARDAVIVALDGTYDQAMAWARQLVGVVGWMKVGMTLYYATGPSIIAELHALGFNVFLDLKMHDIPHQVEGAAYTLGKLGVGMLSVHAAGGPAMIASAVEGATRGAQEAGFDTPTILAITVLTSMDQSTLSKIGVTSPTDVQVERLARLAVDAGATGIVCSPLESSLVRIAVGPHPAIVTPGVRPIWASADDQSRIMTPAQAIEAGSTHLVVGRPITGAADPADAAQRIVTEIESTF